MSRWRVVAHSDHYTPSTYEWQTTKEEAMQSLLLRITAHHWKVTTFTVEEEKL
jgi:hypothetical protein